MEILFSGNKPQKKTYSYSVKENNISNIITFILNKEIEDLDLSSLSCYVKVQGSDIDKDVPSVEVEEDKIKVHWTLLRKHTISHVLKVQLQFEGVDDIVWQTEILTLVLSDTIKADEYIENKYPAVLTNHEERITSLENEGQPTKNNKNFVYASKENIILKKDCRLVFTTSKKRNSKGQKINCWGTKLGNCIGRRTALKGKYDFVDFLSLLFECEVEKILTGAADIEPQFIFPKVFMEPNNQQPQKWIYQTQISIRNEEGEIVNPQKAIREFLPIYSHMSELDISEGSLEGQLLGHCRFMTKFIEDYRELFHIKDERRIKYWGGNMARSWLEIQCCFVYDAELFGEDVLQVYFLPIPRRFA